MINKEKAELSSCFPNCERDRLMKVSRAVSFLGTVTASVGLAAFTCLAVKTYAYMYMPLKTAWLLGAAAAIIPGWLMNKALTASYRKNCDRSAVEGNSFFGSLVSANVLIIPLLFLGAFGPAGKFSAHEATRIGAETLQLVEPIDEATLETFPASETGTGYIWVHNVGTEARPREIARQADGRLQAVYLDSRGKTLSVNNHEAMIGPNDTKRGLVMLVPVPEQAGENRTVDVSWDGGRALFRMRGNSRQATFTDL